MQIHGRKRDNEYYVYGNISKHKYSFGTYNNLRITMQKDVDDTSSDNQFGDVIYQSRHIKVMNWLNKYLGE